MNRNPLIPFAIIAILGILLMITTSFYGLNKSEELASEGEQGGEVAEVPGDPEEIYQQTCAMCHGQNLEGTSAPALDAIGSTHSADEINDIILNGLGSGMPAGLLQGEAAQKVADWLAEHQ